LGGEDGAAIAEFVIWILDVDVIKRLVEQVAEFFEGWEIKPRRFAAIEVEGADFG
jgi:hypothetical protein